MQKRGCIILLILSLVLGGAFACENDPINLIPDWSIEIEFESEEMPSDEVLATIWIGLSDDPTPYEYKLYVYNRKDILEEENWILLKDLGPYSEMYQFSEENGETIYCFSERLQIPEEVFSGNSGMIYFRLDGRSDGSGISQTIKYDYEKEADRIRLTPEVHAPSEDEGIESPDSSALPT